MKNTKDITSASPFFRHAGAGRGRSQFFWAATRGVCDMPGEHTYAWAGPADPAKRQASVQSSTTTRPANTGRRGGVRQKPQNISIS